jgi:hypothetical protein
MSIDTHQYRPLSAELSCGGKLMPINAPVFIWLYQFPLGAIAGRYLSGHPRRRAAGALKRLVAELD